MTEAVLAEVLSSAAAGYWGKDPGAAEVDVRVIRNGDVQPFGHLRWDEIPVRGFTKREAEKATVVPGDLVITTSGYCGQVAYIDMSLDLPLCASNFVRVLRPNESVVNGRYLFHMLNSQESQIAFAPFIRGTTMKNLSFSKAAEHLRVPLPPLEEQERIAAILDKADDLLAKRRAAIAHLDTITQAIYVDMFGDPVVNPRGWPTSRLGDAGGVVTGNTPPRGDASNFGTDIEWIKSDNIDPVSGSVSVASERLSAQGRSLARVVPSGSVLVTCIAGSPNSIGNAGLLDRPVAFNQQINAFVPRHGREIYWFFTIALGKRLVQRASTGGMKGLVSKSKFENVMLPRPPFDLQDKFEREAVAARSVRAAQTLALSQLEHLAQSLRVRAFRGEL